MILSYLKIEFKVIMRKNNINIIYFISCYILYIIYFDIELPEDVKPKFYKEYMYSMTVYSLLSFSLLTFPLDIINEKQNEWRQRLMVTPFTFTSYYISKVVKTMLQFAIAILVIFMVGHFYKGVAMSAVQWLESGIFLWLGASLLITFGILFSLLNDIQKQVL